MNTLTISDALRERIGPAEVRAAVFTTYTLDTAFFEQDVVPLLLPGTGGFSVDPELRTPAVREKLQVSDLAIDVFADSKAYWSEDPRSPAMDYGCFPVNAGNRAFHGKVILLLLRSPGGQESLHVAAGSCNLTRAGWWDNIECQHWEQINPHGAPGDFLDAIRADVAYLRAIRAAHASERGNEGAIPRLESFLAGCESNDEVNSVHYFGLARRREGIASFTSFLKRNVDELRIGRCEAIEIVSPFFADDSANVLHRDLASGVAGQTCPTRVLLPLDEEDRALCAPEYFEHVQHERGLDWSEWNGDLASALGIGGDQYRRLHAKAFQIMGEESSALFVGSVNFSRKALYENIEAGFLVRHPRRKSLLTALGEGKAPEISRHHLEEAPGEDEAAQDTPPLTLSLHFDWLEEELEAIYPEKEPISVDLLGAEGKERPLVRGWRIDPGKTGAKAGVYRPPNGTDLHEFKKHLERSGMVAVQVGPADPLSTSQETSARQWCLVQQSHWTHKPPVAPVLLTDAQILAVYAGMSREDRQIMISNARMRMLMREGLISLEDAVESDPIQSQFFARYAEIFHAFRSLRKRLLDSKGARIDYYLTGAGPDSMPQLIEVAMDSTVSAEDSGEVDWVSSYLILLSALELYRRPEFSKRTGVARRIDEVEGQLSKVRTRLSLPDEQDRQSFFDWFEGQFFKEYQATELEA